MAGGATRTAEEMGGATGTAGGAGKTGGEDGGGATPGGGGGAGPGAAHPGPAPTAGRPRPAPPGGRDGAGGGGGGRGPRPSEPCRERRQALRGSLERADSARVGEQQRERPQRRGGDGISAE